MATEAEAEALSAGGIRPSEVLRRSAAYLERHDVESPLATAEALLMHVLGTDRAGLYSRSQGLDAPTARLYGRALCRRCTGQPLQHLTGRQQFRDLSLRVEQGVFIPRPETEVLVEAGLAVVAHVPAPVVVDVGTGTGAIAMAVKQVRPEATVVAIDISPEAVTLARENAAQAGLDVEVLEGDLLSPVSREFRGAVDAVLSNPPYVEPEDYDDLSPEVRADPYRALVGGTEIHRRLSSEAGSWLCPGGWLVMEIGEDQGDEVREVLQGHGFESVEVLPDLAGRDRVVKGRRPPVRPA